MLAGGRYNSLSQQYLGRDVAAIGWAAGMDRLALLLQESGRDWSVEKPRTVTICSFLMKEEQEHGAEVRKLCYKLRQKIQRDGLRVLVDVRDQKMSDKLTHSFQSENSQSVITVGVEELRSGVVTVKHDWEDRPIKVAID